MKAIGQRIFLSAQLISMARQDREDIPREELKLAFLCLVVLVGLQCFLDQLIESACSLRYCGMHVVRANRQAIFFGIVL